MTTHHTLKRRFSESVVPIDLNECWRWRGSCASNGYGRIMIDYVNWLAHRLSWVVYYKKDIPDGFCVLHSCDNPPCVNPHHLFLGNTKDNAIDRSMKDRGFRPKGELHHMAKITEDDVLSIRRLKRYGIKTGSLSEHFGVQPRQIRRIVSRYSWSHI